MASLSRSAGSPALPTAITTRPQLASSPAIAVFTSGELAMERAMRCAPTALLGAVDGDLDEFARAFAVLHHLMREIEQHLVERPAEIGERAIAGAAYLRRAALCRRAGGESSSVSEVEVSLSTVMVLKGRDTGATAAPAAPPRRSARR